MELQPSEIALLKDLARAKSSWVNAAMEGIREPATTPWFDDDAAWQQLATVLQSEESRLAFRSVVSELLSGLVHSVLVSFDGGSELADTTALSITDGDGYQFRRFLHEFWPEYSDSSQI